MSRRTKHLQVTASSKCWWTSAFSREGPAPANNKAVWGWTLKSHPNRSDVIYRRELLHEPSIWPVHQLLTLTATS